MPYALGHRAAMSCRSENHVNQMARLTDFELAQFTYGKTTENPQCGILGMHIRL